MSPTSAGSSKFEPESSSNCQMSTNSGGEVVVEFQQKKKKKKKLKLKRDFEDRYELTGNKLGEGSFSVVLECQSVKPAPGAESVLYAVKVIDQTNARSKNEAQANREQVLKEVELLTMCIDHPNVIQLQAFFETECEMKLVFEKLDGGELLSHIEGREKFTEREASQVTRDIANALSFLHAKGIAHRDLKPANILCVSREQASPAKVCDFNLGVSRQKGDSITPVITTPVGTPEFMAPEVVSALTDDTLTYDKRCDIWSLGVIIFIMLSGHPPFTGDCGYDCGWKNGDYCEFCLEDLETAIVDCKYDFKVSNLFSCFQT